MPGRGLGKVCSKLRIPVPPRGYWAPFSNGQKLTKPRFARGIAFERQPRQSGDSEQLEGLQCCISIEGQPASRQRFRGHKKNSPTKRSSWYIEFKAITEVRDPTEKPERDTKGEGFVSKPPHFFVLDLLQ